MAIGVSTLHGQAASALSSHATDAPPRSSPLPLRAAVIATALLPLLLIHARGVAEGVFAVLALGFVLRCALQRDWSAFRQAWVLAALAYWAWLVFVTVLAVSWIAASAVASCAPIATSRRSPTGQSRRRASHTSGVKVSGCGSQAITITCCARRISTRSGYREHVLG